LNPEPLIPIPLDYFKNRLRFGRKVKISHSRLNYGENTMGKIVVIDTEECIGCESCVEICPEVFGFNEAEEKAEVIMPEDGPEDCIEDAMDTCPVECIHYTE
jgi:ferredoxin